MFENLIALLKSEFGAMHVTKLAVSVANLVSMVDASVLKDGSTKNAAIDALISMLQSHKDPVTTTPITAPVTATTTTINSTVSA